MHWRKLDVEEEQEEREKEEIAEAKDGPEDLLE